MRPLALDFERLLQKVHRRYVVLRIVESTGLGVLAGCTLGMPLVGIAFWRSVPTMPIMVGAFAVGAAAGFLWGCVNRPTLIAAAAEADRQLDNADLLSTAHSIRHSADPWAAAVRESADSWSRRVTPSSVILNRLGARAWGGIGLAATLLFVLALLPVFGTTTQAANHPPIGKAFSADSPEQPRHRSGANLSRSIPQQDPEDLRASQMVTGDPALRAIEKSESGRGRGAGSNLEPSGNGGAESHSASHISTLPEMTLATHSRESSARGRTASGAGQSAQPLSGAGSNDSQLASSDRSTPSTPPWKFAKWAEDGERARRAVDSGEVPAQYRDVIGGYFSRP